MQIYYPQINFIHLFHGHHGGGDWNRDWDWVMGWDEWEWDERREKGAVMREAEGAWGRLDGGE